MPRVTTPKQLKPAGKQLKLSSFFSPKQENGKSSPKVTNGDCDLKANDMEGDEGSVTPPLKRTKLEDAFNKEEDGIGKSEYSNGGNGVPIANGAASPVTAEMKKKINENAIGARLIRASKELRVIDPEMGKTWFSALETEFKKEYFKQLNDFVLAARNRTTVYPPPNHVWEWSKHFPIEEVKVVILGQDPYHGPNQAHGLCFSVKKGVPPPPSLKNIYQELKNDVPGFVEPNHGYLIGWAEQGVLLLNAVLTVERGNPNSHQGKGWENITDAVVKWISTNLRCVVFFLWGAYAKKKGAIVDRKKHLVLEGAHPSPFSARNGFFGCKHFSKCNEYLEKQGKKPVDWSNLP